ncbi:OmpA family protein [Defluviimonas sp. SAOS-178_SWC]|uniref:OmpA family protein n=1 Tax=Defluviimonas sp. SAOS-178_SWC TaxID=3121287 RepID=UPI0032219A20
MPFPHPARLAPAILLCQFAAGAALACAQYDDIVAAVEGNDAASAAALYEVIAVAADCDDALREWLGDYLARDAFLKAMDDRTAPEDRRAGLTRALGFEKHWRSYAELGRLDWSAHKFGSAAVNFQLAINELVEGDPKHAAETSEIAEVYQLASASLALADGVVDMPKTRSGEMGGVFATSIRGFSVEEVDLPITFKFASTQFDERGAEYAQMLADHLKGMGAAHIALAGHTDPIGTEEYNNTLSLARADAVAGFLKSHGYSGEIETEGFGESQLPPPPPGVAEGSEEHYRIARRVGFQTR